MNDDQVEARPPGVSDHAANDFLPQRQPIIHRLYGWFFTLFGPVLVIGNLIGCFASAAVGRTGVAPMQLGNIIGISMGCCLLASGTALRKGRRSSLISLGLAYGFLLSAMGVAILFFPKDRTPAPDLMAMFPVAAIPLAGLTPLLISMWRTWNMLAPIGATTQEEGT